MTYQLIKGSAHHLPTIADGSVHAIICSPPYYGLRAYSGDQLIEWPTIEYSPMPGLAPITIQGCEPGCVHEWGDELPGPKYQPQQDDLGRKDLGEIVPDRMDTVSTEPVKTVGKVEDWHASPLFAEVQP